MAAQQGQAGPSFNSEHLIRFLLVWFETELIRPFVIHSTCLYLLGTEAQDFLALRWAAAQSGEQ